MQSSVQRLSSVLAWATVLSATLLQPVRVTAIDWDPNQTAGVTLGGSGNWNNNDPSNLAWWNGTANVVWPNTTTTDAAFTGAGGFVTNTMGNAIGGLRLNGRHLSFVNHTGDYTILDDGASSSRLLVGNITVASQTQDRTVTIDLDQVGLTTSANGSATTVRVFEVGPGDTLRMTTSIRGGGYRSTSHIAYGAGGIQKVGTGTLHLAQGTSAFFSGGIRLEAGTLIAESDLALLRPGTSGGTVNDNKLTFTAGTFDYRGVNAISNSVDFNGAVTVTSGGDSPVDYMFNGDAFFGQAVLQLTANSTLDIPAGRTVTIAKSLNETAPWSVTKTGAGTLVLQGEHYYSGGTTMEEGTVLLLDSFSSGSGYGAVTVKNNARLGGRGAISGNVTLAAGARLAMELTVGDTNKITVGGNLTLTATNILDLTLAAGIVPNGTYTLVEVSGALSGSAADLVVNAPLGRQTYTPVVDTSGWPHKIQVTVSGLPPASLVWQGDDVANVWDVGGASNWWNGAVADAFFTGDSVSFTDAGSTSPAVDLVTAVEPGAVTVNAAGDYTIGGSGKIGGSGPLTKAGTGTLTLATLNDYTGVTTISAGTLQLGDGTASGSLVGDVLNDGVLVLDSPGNLTLGGVISGTGRIIKNNSNKVALSGDNTYAGGTVVNDGALSIGAGGTTGWVIGNITNHGSVIFNRSDDVTFDPVISGSGSVIQEGNGTLTLTAANTYTGLTWVRNGTAKLTLANLSGECVRGDILLDATTGGTARQMRLGAPEQIADSAVVTLTSDGTAVRFYLQGHHETIAGLSSSPSGNKDVRAVDSGDNFPATLTLKVPAGQSHVYAGGLNDVLAGSGLNSALTIVKDGPGTQTFAGGGQNFSGGLAILDGTLVLESAVPNSLITNNASLVWAVAPGTLLARTLEVVGTGSVTVSNGGALLLNAPLAAGSLSVVAGTLGGTGAITAPVTVQTNGILSPGASPLLDTNVLTTVGTLTVNGNLTLQGTVLMEVNKDVTGQTNDLVAGVQTLQYGGALVVNNLGVTPLALGDTFTLFNPASASGDFTGITPAPGTGLGWSFDPQSGVLSVVTGVDPTPPDLMFSLSGSDTLELEWPASHQGWIAQSNAVNVADPSLWFDIAGSEAGTSLSLPMDPAMTNVFYRLRLPQP